jgi:hypothetical protein
MTNPNEEHEDVKELAAHENLSHAPRDSEQAGEDIYREGHDPPFDDPETDAARGSWGLYLLAGIVLAIAAYVLYLVFS